MKQTHEEFGYIEGLGTVFITGVSDKCDHIFEDTVYILGNGDIIYEKDIRCPTNEATQEYLFNIAEDRNTYVSEMTGCCIKCKKPYNPMKDPAFWE